MLNKGNSISYQINISNLTTDFYQVQIFSGTQVAGAIFGVLTVT